MATLIVRPIDLDAPGSYRIRSRVMRLIRELTDKENTAVQMAAYEQAETLILDRLSTDDRSSVDAALDKLSANEFDALFAQLIPDAPSPNPASAGG